MQKSYLKLCGHKIWKIMALGSTNEFSRKNQSGGPTPDLLDFSRALPIWVIIGLLKCYTRAIILYKLTIIVIIG